MPKKSEGFQLNPNSTHSRANVAICKRVRAVRIKEGYTQAEFSKICGVSESKIKQIEVGLQLPLFDVLRRLVRKFNVSYDYLIDGKSV